MAHDYLFTKKIIRQVQDKIFDFSKNFFNICKESILVQWKDEPAQIIIPPELKKLNIF
jgi:hypothetical protein